MKLGAVIPVLNEWRFLPAVVGQLAKVCDRVLVLRSDKSLSGAAAELSAVPASFPDKADLICGQWDSEHAIRNAGMDALDDCDYVLSVDTDEILPDDGLAAIKRGIAVGSRAVVCRLYTYWKTIGYRIDPPEQLFAPVAVRRDTRFKYLRQVNIRPGEAVLVDRYAMHHLSYVRTDEEMLEKLRLFGHAKEIVPGWYDKIWKAWDQNRELENLHPTHPSAYRRAVADFKHGAEIERILAEHGVS